MEYYGIFIGLALLVLFAYLVLAFWLAWRKAEKYRRQGVRLSGKIVSAEIKYHWFGRHYRAGTRFHYRFSYNGQEYTLPSCQMTKKTGIYDTDRTYELLFIPDEPKEVFPLG